MWLWQGTRRLTRGPNKLIITNQHQDPGHWPEKDSKIPIQKIEVKVTIGGKEEAPPTSEDI